MTIFLHRGRTRKGPLHYSKFIARWDTTQEGSSNDTIVLPLVADGTYDFYIDWGDGNKDTITGYDQSEVTHQYSDTGIYTIQLVANDMVGWQFNDSGDDDKLVEIIEWGPLRFVSDDTNLFKGCSNLTLSTTSNPPFNADVSGMFQDCSSLTGTGGNIMYWDMSSVTGMNFMLAGCTSLDVDLSNWDVSSIKNAEGFLFDAALSTMNYDKTLSGWATQEVQSGVTISFGSSQYSSQSGELYRNALISSGWHIIDGGKPPVGFISTWNTSIMTNPIPSGHSSNRPTSPSDSITLPLSDGGYYDFTVNWGDGSEDHITSYNQSEVTHQYSSTGIYNISITGGITGWKFNGVGDRLKILDVSRWGPLVINNQRSFFDCQNLYLTATDGLKMYTDPSWDANALDFCRVPLGTGGNMDNWDVSGVYKMMNFFNTSQLNMSLDNWDTSNVSTFNAMFGFCSNFNNGGSTGIGNWDTSNVTDMELMFVATPFNQPIGYWDTSNVTNMKSMFYEAPAFNQPLGNWDTSNVTSMHNMFRMASGFNQDIGSWDMSNVTTTRTMFWAQGLRDSASGFNNGGSSSISGWNTSSLQMMNQMFDYNYIFDQPLGGWDVSNVTSATEFMMHGGLSTANYDDTLIGWGAQGVQNGVNIHFGTSRYSAGAAASARQALVNRGWTISDGGQA